MIGDDHQLNSRGLYTHSKDSSWRWDAHPQYKEFRPLAHVEDDWHLFEQIDRTSGQQYNAKDVVLLNGKRRETDRWF